MTAHRPWPAPRSASTASGSRFRASKTPPCCRPAQKKRIEELGSEDKQAIRQFEIERRDKPTYDVEQTTHLFEVFNDMVQLLPSHRQIAVERREAVLHHSKALLQLAEGLHTHTTADCAGRARCDDCRPDHQTCNKKGLRSGTMREGQETNKR